MALNIESFRKHKGLSRDELAAKAGISTMHLYRLEKGKVRLTEKMAIKLAKALGVRPDDLLDRPGTGTVGARVIGEVQAGVFRVAEEDPLHIEDWENLADNDHEIIPAPPDSRFPHAKIFALRVRGDSMDKMFPEGSYALCVRFEDTGLLPEQIEDGAIVVFQRRLHDVYETTLKRLERLSDGCIQLSPESSNKKHKSYKLCDGDEDMRIAALVVGKYERM